MTSNTIARVAGQGIVALSCGLVLLACDASDLQGRSQVVSAVASAQEVDDVSLDQEVVRPTTHSDDDKENPNPKADGLDHEEPDVVGLRWANPKRAHFMPPKAPEGDWLLEIRAHAGEHEMRWVQGPYDVEEVAELGLRLDPPREAFDPDKPELPLRVMARLVLEKADGSRSGPMALPALVMQGGPDLRTRFALAATLPLKFETVDGKSFANADLPSSL